MQSFILRHKPQITIISGTLIAAGLVARFALYSQPAYAAARRLREMEAAGEAERKALLEEPLPPSMALEQMIEGTRKAIEACLNELKAP